jgi:hypothetical protein
VDPRQENHQFDINNYCYHFDNVAIDLYCKFVVQHRYYYSPDADAGNFVVRNRRRHYQMLTNVSLSTFLVANIVVLADCRNAVVVDSLFQLHYERALALVVYLMNREDSGIEFAVSIMRIEKEKSRVGQQIVSKDHCKINLH